MISGVNAVKMYRPKEQKEGGKFAAFKSKTRLFGKAKATTPEPGAGRSKAAPREDFFKGRESALAILDHPAYGIPGEDIPKFTDLPEQKARQKEVEGRVVRRDISSLLDVGDGKAPEWKPLFGDDIREDVPDVKDVVDGTLDDVAPTPRLLKDKGKGKAVVNRNASTESFQSAVESVSEAPKGLPDAYQANAGKPAELCPQYNYASLYNGRRVRELWNPSGDTLVYLCAKNATTPRGPSFLVNSFQLQATSDYWVVAFSPIWQGGFDIDTTTYPTAKYALFFAPDRPDGKTEETDPLALLRHYITMRNVFACIFDSYCVGLIEDDSPLLTDLVDRMLMYFEGAEDRLGPKLSEFIVKSGLWDVSNDPVKAVDLLHLAHTYEMKELYLEAFAHCVGMYESAQRLRQTGQETALEVLSDSLRLLLTLRVNNLSWQLSNVAGHLEKFHLKALWSHKSPATKLSNTVRQSYEFMRTFLFKYYSATMGTSWPPKNLISRPIFSRVYADMCALYALMVDKQYNTTTAVNSYPSLLPFVECLYYIDNPKGCGGCGINMPYGMPILPGYFMHIIRRDDTSIRRPDLHRFYEENKLSQEGLDKLMAGMYNSPSTTGPLGEAMTNGKDILKAFITSERTLVKGKPLKTIVETRKGIWLMVYAMLSVMAEISVEENVSFKEGVEYFLCADPEGACTWEEGREERDAEAAKKAQREGDADGWSVASLEDKPNEATAEETAETGETSETATAAAKPTERKRAELSFPWIVLEGPEWQGNTYTPRK